MMMTEEKNKRLKYVFFNVAVHFYKNLQDEDTEAISLVSLGQDKANKKSQIATVRNLMPPRKGDVRYWLDNQFLSLTRREIKYRYTDTDIYATDNNIYGMGNQKLMLLVRKHKKEKHILENVLIGKITQNF